MNFPQREIIKYINLPKPYQRYIHVCVKKPVLKNLLNTHHLELVWNLNQSFIEIPQTKWIEKNALLRYLNNYYTLNWKTKICNLAGKLIF